MPTTDRERPRPASGGCSPWRIAHAAAYARLNAGDGRDEQQRSARRSERSAISWSATATGMPSASARQKFAW